jgi:molybdate transport system ATP-binding protein
MSSPSTLVELENVSVRVAGATLLSHLTWSLHTGENWAVRGNNGAGKTTFLRLVRGDVWPAAGGGRRLYHLNGKTQEGPIGFRENTGLVSSELLDLYRTMEWDLSGLDVVYTGFEGTPLISGKPDEARMEQAREILATLRITSLSDRRIRSMSHGEAKKILIARAMVKNPGFLFLDEVDSGLDSRSYGTVMDLVHEVVERGTHVLMATHGNGSVPSFITHTVRLHGGRIEEQGPACCSAATECTEPGQNTICQSRSVSCRPLRDGDCGKPLINIANVDVVRQGKKIVHQVNWTVNTGQNWAVLGENGSGKTTLLKLVIGDLRPVWGGKISRFGRDGLQSIWGLRKRISLVTPDWQAMHATSQTGLNMVLSGFFGTVGLVDTPADEHIAAARSWFVRLGLQALEQREVRTLSYGQVRALLVMRAVVTNPTMLLLDEALSGLDATARTHVMTAVEEFARGDTSVIYVTHNVGEVSALFDHVAVLAGGRLVFQGTREQWLAWNAPSGIAHTSGS